MWANDTTMFYKINCIYLFRNWRKPILVGLLIGAN